MDCFERNGNIRHISIVPYHPKFIMIRKSNRFVYFAIFGFQAFSSELFTSLTLFEMPVIFYWLKYLNNLFSIKSNWRIHSIDLTFVIDVRIV